jgi:hypothetical protein
MIGGVHRCEFVGVRAPGNEHVAPFVQPDLADQPSESKCPLRIINVNIRLDEATRRHINRPVAHVVETKQF